LACARDLRRDLRRGPAILARHRNVLLAGTAALAWGGGFLGTTQPGHATCTTVVAGQVVTCAGATAGSQTFTSTTAPWTYTLVDTGGTFGTTITGSAGTSSTVGVVGITNNGNYNGTVNVNANTAIVNNASGSRPGLVISNSSGASGTVTVNIDGKIETNTGNSDAVRLTGGYNYTVNVGATGQLTGGDDGIVVTGANGLVTIDNKGTITVLGTSGSASNLSDGILIASGGSPGTNINGAATVTNSGTVTGFTAGTPTDGGSGISVSANGAISITNTEDGSLNAANAGGNFGIFAHGSSTIDITNDGNIGVSGGQIKVNGIDATNTTSTLIITNNGEIGANSNRIAGIGINAASTSGAITVGNYSNSIWSVGDGIHAVSGGVVTVYNGDGTDPNPDGYINSSAGNGIYAQSTGGSGGVIVSTGSNSSIVAALHGIFALTNSSDLTVTNLGTIDSGQQGIRAESAGDGTTTLAIDNSGEINAGWTAIRTKASGGAATVIDNRADIFSTGGYGIHASASGGGDITITNHEGVDISNDSSRDGIHAWSDGGHVSVTNDGTIGSVETVGGEGIHASSAGGGVDVLNTGSIWSTDDGIHARDYDGGNVNIFNTGYVRSYDGDGLHGSTSGGGWVGVVNGWDPVNGYNYDAYINADGRGIYARARDGGNVGVANWGGYGEGTGGIDAGNDGIYARASGSGAIGVENMGVIGLTDAVGGDGIYARSYSGVIGIANGYDIFTDTTNTAASIWAEGDGIHAYSSHGGSIGIVNFGNITADGTGIYARSRDGSGDIGILNYGNIVADDDGIYAQASHRGDGRIYVSNGYGYSTYYPNAFIYSTDGNGISTRINAGNSYVGTNTRIDNYGYCDPFTAGSCDPTNVNHGGGVFAPWGSAIHLRNYSLDGYSQITNYGTLIGRGSRWDPVIDIRTNADGPGAGIYNDGVIASTALPTYWSGATWDDLYNGTLPQSGGGLKLSDLAGAAGDHLLTARGAGVAVENEGLMFGRVDLRTSNANVIDNFGAWYTVGRNRFFGGPNDTVNNYGLVQTAVDNSSSESTRFLGLNYFNNYGTLSMRDGLEGDRTYISGNYWGGAGSLLKVDSFLGIGDDLSGGSQSDRLVVGGDTSGRTGIVIHDTNTGPAAFVPYDAAQASFGGIQVVDVAGAVSADNFYISPLSDHYDPRFGGVISKGLFFYYLAKVGDPQFNLFSAPDVTAYQLPKAITAAQNIWYESALMWEDRQTELRTKWLRGPMMAMAADMPVKAAPAPVPATALNSVWLKGIGSWTTRKSTDSFAGADRVFDHDTGYKQDTYGLIGGVNFGRESVFTAADVAMLGLMGGYLDSKVRFNSAGTTYHYTGGTFGVSGSWMAYNGMFVDVLGKGDFLKVGIDMPLVAFGVPGFSMPSANVTTWGVIANIGQRFDQGAWFVEPIATLTYARTKVDDLNLALLGTNVSFGNGESFRGAIGARFGALLPMWQGHRVEASITARVWDEFAGNSNTATFVNPGPDLGPLTDNFTKVFGEVKGGIDVFSTGPGGWGAFINGGVKFNNDTTAVTAKAGATYTW
jgi:outer membrane autotransporter protein